MKLERIENNGKTFLHYHFDETNTDPTDEYNVARDYECNGTKATDHMTHDDAVADIRDRTQRGFYVSEF